MNFPERAAHFLLRVGTAFAFLYPPIRAVFDPITWLGYVPSFVRALPAKLGFAVDSLSLLHAFGIAEIMLAIWILFGRNIRIPAFIATFVLLVIVALNPADIDVVFRDISIAMMALALAVWPKQRSSEAE